MSALRNLALAAVAAAAIAGSAQAQSTTTPPVAKPMAGMRGPGRNHEGHKGAFKDLNLTDAQKAQMKAIHAKYQPQLKASREQAKPLMEAARAAKQKGDTAAFRANIEKARQVSTGIRAQEMNEIRAVLTPDQQAKADAAMAQRKEEHGERAGKHGHGKKNGKVKGGRR